MTATDLDDGVGLEDALVHEALRRYRVQAEALTELAGEWLAANLLVELAAADQEPGSALKYLTAEARRSVAGMELVRWIGSTVKPIVVDLGG